MTLLQDAVPATRLRDAVPATLLRDAVPANRPGLSLRSFFTVFLVFLESELNIIQQVVVRRLLTKLVGGAIPDHETIERIAFEVGNLQYDGPVEAVVDEFVVFLIPQSSLEGLDAFGPCEAEHIDQLIKVYSCAGSIGAGADDLKSGLFKIENFGVVFSVLDGIIPITAGHHLYLFQLGRVYVEGNIKAIVKIERFDGVPHRSLAEVRKIDRIFEGDGYLVFTIGVGGSAAAGSAENANTVEWPCPVHIVHGTVYVDLAPGVAVDKEEE